MTTPSSHMPVAVIGAGRSDSPRQSTCLPGPKHPRLVDAHRAVHDALRQPTAPSLIVLYLSAQLSRRSVEIHFGRYRATVDRDRQVFKSALLTFQGHLPVSEEDARRRGCAWNNSYQVEHGIRQLRYLARNWKRRLSWLSAVEWNQN